MSLLAWFKDKFSQQSAHFIYHAFEPDHLDVDARPALLEAGRHYFRLWLCEMYLNRSVDWFQTWHPAVHSLIRFRFGTQELDIAHIAGAFNIPEFKPNSLEHIIPLNYEMTTLMPFNGGTVELTAGLLGMKGENYLNNFLKVMGDFAGLIKVPQLSAALTVAGTVASGIEYLLGNTNGRLELGLHQTFVAGGGGGNDLRSGYFLVILAEPHDLPMRKPADRPADYLWVVKDRLQFGPSLRDSKPLKGFTYMLFRIEGREGREDWQSLTSIATPFAKAIDALGEMENEKAESFLRAALVTAIQSPDLTRWDRSRVVQAIKDEYDLRKKELGFGAMPGKPATLEDAMSKAMSVDEAMSAPEPSLSSLFAEREA